MAQYYEYKEYKIKLEYFNLEDIIKIEVELIDTNEKYCKTICSRDIELPVKKFNTILTNGLELKPNYFVEFSKLTHQSKNRLEIKARLNYDDLVDITETIYLDEYKAYQNYFETRINELEEKINTKIEEVEIFYKKHIETLVQTNKVLKEQIESLNNIVYKIESKLVDNNFIFMEECHTELNKNIYEITFGESGDGSLHDVGAHFRCCLQISLKYIDKFGCKSGGYIQNKILLPKLNDLENDYTGRINYYEQILKKILYFNIKKFKIEGRYNKEIFKHGLKFVEMFLDSYLTNRNDFIVDEIEIYDNRLIDTLIKHSNYKKLVIKQDNNFNDNQIKAHCKSNNIEFEYIILVYI